MGFGLRSISGRRAGRRSGRRRSGRASSPHRSLHGSLLETSCSGRIWKRKRPSIHLPVMRLHVNLSEIKLTLQLCFTSRSTGCSGLLWVWDVCSPGWRSWLDLEAQINLEKQNFPKQQSCYKRISHVSWKDFLWAVVVFEMGRLGSCQERKEHKQFGVDEMDLVSLVCVLVL